MAGVITPGNGKLHPGSTLKVLGIESGAAGSQVAEFAIESDSVLGALFVENISGTLNVQFFTFSEDGREALIFDFPPISAPTPELLFSKAAVSLTNIRVKCSWTGSVKFDLRARGLGVGETTTTILSPSKASASQITVGTIAQVVVPSSFSDRKSLVIVNNNSVGILYIGYTLAEATIGNGYPLLPGSQLGIDLESGTIVYAVGSVSIDARIMQSGG
jgi:hypothetical protein